MVHGDALFRIEGIVQELHIGDGHQYLLSAADGHYRGQSGSLAPAASLDMFVESRNAIMAASHDGEETENFAFIIDDDIVCGQFAGASKLKSGMPIIAVVSQKGPVLLAHALLWKEHDMLWMTHPLGWRADRAAKMRFGAILATATVAMMMVFELFIGNIFGSIWIDLAIYIAASIGMVFLAAGGAAVAMQEKAGPATEVFRLLGCKDPERVDLTKSSYLSRHFHEIIQRREQVHTYHDIYYLDFPSV